MYLSFSFFDSSIQIIYFKNEMQLVQIHLLKIPFSDEKFSILFAL